MSICRWVSRYLAIWSWLHVTFCAAFSSNKTNNQPPVKATPPLPCSDLCHRPSGNPIMELPGHDGLTWLDTPEDIWVEIFRLVSPSVIVKLGISCTNRRLQELCTSERIWKIMQHCWRVFIGDETLSATQRRKLICSAATSVRNIINGCCKARRILSFAPRSPSHLDSYFKGHKQYVSLLEEHSYGSYGNSSIVKEYCVIDHCKPESSAVKTLAQPPQGSGLLFYASDDGRSILRTPNTVRSENGISFLTPFDTGPGRDSWTPKKSFPQVRSVLSGHCSQPFLNMDASYNTIAIVDTTQLALFLDSGKLLRMYRLPNHVMTSASSPTALFGNNFYFIGADGAIIVLDCAVTSSGPLTPASHDPTKTAIPRNKPTKSTDATSTTDPVKARSPTQPTKEFMPATSPPSYARPTAASQTRREASLTSRFCTSPSASVSMKQQSSANALPSKPTPPMATHQMLGDQRNLTSAPKKAPARTPQMPIPPHTLLDPPAPLIRLPTQVAITSCQSYVDAGELLVLHTKYPTTLHSQSRTPYDLYIVDLLHAKLRLSLCGLPSVIAVSSIPLVAMDSQCVYIVSNNTIHILSRADLSYLNYVKLCAAATGSLQQRRFIIHSVGRLVISSFKDGEAHPTVITEASWQAEASQILNVSIEHMTTRTLVAHHTRSRYIIIHTSGSNPFKKHRNGKAFKVVSEVLVPLITQQYRDAPGIEEVPAHRPQQHQRHLRAMWPGKPQEPSTFVGPALILKHELNSKGEYVLADLTEEEFMEQIGRAH